MPCRERGEGHAMSLPSIGHAQAIDGGAPRTQPCSVWWLRSIIGCSPQRRLAVIDAGRRLGGSAVEAPDHRRNAAPWSHEFSRLRARRRDDPYLEFGPRQGCPATTALATLAIDWITAWPAGRTSSLTGGSPARRRDDHLSSRRTRAVSACPSRHMKGLLVQGSCRMDDWSCKESGVTAGAT